MDDVDGRGFFARALALGVHPKQTVGRLVINAVGVGAFPLRQREAAVRGTDKGPNQCDSNTLAQPPLKWPVCQKDADCTPAIESRILQCRSDQGGPAYSRHQSSGSEQPVLSIEALACYWLRCLVTVGGDGRQDTGGLTDALPGDSELVVGNGISKCSLRGQTQR